VQSYPPIYYPPAWYYPAGIAISFGVGVDGGILERRLGLGLWMGYNDIDVNNNRNSNINRGNRPSNPIAEGGNRGTLEVCRGYVEAQYDYAFQKREGYDVNQYAQRIISTPGKQDGLAWQNSDGTWGGPVGEKIAHAIVSLCLGSVLSPS